MATFLCHPHLIHGMDQDKKKEVRRRQIVLDNILLSLTVKSGRIVINLGRLGNLGSK